MPKRLCLALAGVVAARAHWHYGLPRASLSRIIALSHVSSTTEQRCQTWCMARKHPATSVVPESRPGSSVESLGAVGQRDALATLPKMCGNLPTGHNGLGGSTTVDYDAEDLDVGVPDNGPAWRGGVPVPMMSSSLLLHGMPY